MGGGCIAANACVIKFLQVCWQSESCAIILCVF